MEIKFAIERRAAWHRGSRLPSHPATPGLILRVPTNFSLDVAEIYCQHCLEQLVEA